MDTLYFVSDLNKTIQKIKTLLKPDGKMFIFYSHKGKAEQSELNNIKPRKNELEEALTFSGFEFRSWDFAKNEHMIWKKTIEIANELKDRFQI